MNIDLDYKQLGVRIKRHRTVAELTQEQLASIVDVATSNISHIERATTKVSLPTLVKIANALGVSLDQLVCDSLPVSERYLEKDFAELLADCTLEEKRILKDIVVATKKTLRERTGG
mgnify:CR=1 FL=1